MQPDEHGNFIRADADRHPDLKERAEIERREKIDGNFLGIEARFAEIDESFKALRFEMANNTEITKQVRDVLASFRVMGSVAKWCTAVGAFGVMCWHGVQEWRK